MALIGTIRKNTWVLIVVIGLGMFGFILMDMIGQNNNIGGGGTDVGSIEGRTVSIQEFQNKQNAMFSNSGIDGNEQRERVWNFFVQQTLVNNAANKLGIGVGDEEIQTLFDPNNRNFSYVIVNDLRTPQGFDVEQYQQIRASLGQQGNSPEEQNLILQRKQFWKDLEQRVELDHKTGKIANIVAKAIYTPTWMAEMEGQVQNQKIDFRFVSIPYASVQEDVKVTDADLKAYIKENKGEYTSDEPTRTIEYVAFDVIPTSADSTIIRDRVANLATSFAAETEDSLFVLNNNGSYDPSYVRKEGVDPPVADSLFTAEVGTVIGPYQLGRQYKAVKLIDRMPVADSVKVRRILIQGNPNGKNAFIKSFEQGEKLADSINTVLTADPTQFDSLYVKYNEDLTSLPQNGDLGWLGTLNSEPKEFTDFVFYKATKGKFYNIPSRTGFHILQVTDTKSTGAIGVKVAYVGESIVPSEKTEKAAYSKAREFTSKNRDLKSFRENGNKNGLKVEKSGGLTRNGYTIFGLNGNSSREAIKWAFEDASKGNVAKDVYTYEDPEDFYESKHVVMALANVSSAGLASVDDVRETITPLVQNQKKAEIIKKKIPAGASLDDIAAAFPNVEVQTANQISMKSYFVPGLGAEPKILAAAFNTELNKVSTPVAGLEAVGVVETTFKPAAPPATDIPSIRRTVSSPMLNRVAPPSREYSFLLSALKKASDITDRRYKFY